MLLGLYCFRFRIENKKNTISNITYNITKNQDEYKFGMGLEIHYYKSIFYFHKNNSNILFSRKMNSLYEIVWIQELDYSSKIYFVKAKNVGNKNKQIKTNKCFKICFSLPYR